MSGGGSDVYENFAYPPRNTVVATPVEIGNSKRSKPRDTIRALILNNDTIDTFT